MPLVVVLGVLGAVAGVGLLYLLRNAGVGDAGPKASGALPLEQLAASDAQPLLRMALAWLPVGLAVGALIATVTRVRPVLALVVAALTAGVVLVVSGGVSVSVENNESLTGHLTALLGAAGTWVSIALLVIGVAAGQALAAASARAPNAA
jgi:hypothetical protein